MMLLDLFTFFGTGILGACLNRSLIAGRKAPPWRLLFCGALVAVFVHWILAFNLPFRGFRTELLCAIFGTISVVLIMMNFPFYEDEKSPFKPAGCLNAALILLFPIASFTMVGRVDHAQKVAKTLDGMVIQKYRSSNHAARSIVVMDSNRSITTFEGMDVTTWDSIIINKSRVHKVAWSAFGEVDGQWVRIVKEGSVAFWGRFRD